MRKISEKLSSMFSSRGASAPKILLWFAIAFAMSLAGYYVSHRVAGPATDGELIGCGPPPEIVTEAEQSTPRLLFAQIVDDEPKDVFVERAILEGRPFKYLLKRAANKTCADLRAATDEKLLFEYLSDEPELHRGEAYTPGRGVVVEVSRVELDPAYGFPPGWTVLPAVYINTAKEIYALRFICPPESKLFERLKKGIDDDELPVINLAGLFFKNYARKTGDPKEKPWARPLLVCPEPEFTANVEPRHVLKELQEAGFGNLLPSQRIEAPGAEERLIVEVALSKDNMALKTLGMSAPVDATDFLKAAVATLKKRLPAEHAQHLSAVFLLRGGPLSDIRFQKAVAEIKAAGVERVFIRLDAAK